MFARIWPKHVRRLSILVTVLPLAKCVSEPCDRDANVAPVVEQADDTPYAKCFALFVSVCERKSACGTDASCSPDAQCQGVSRASLGNSGADDVSFIEAVEACTSDLKLATCDVFKKPPSGACAKVFTKAASQMPEPDDTAIELGNRYCGTRNDGSQFFSFTDGTGVYCGPSHYGLIWQLKVPMQTYSHSEASDYCSNLTLTGRNWRLPTIVELESIGGLRPGVDIFDITYGDIPGQPQETFWSSSPAPSNDGDFIGYDYSSTSRSSSTPKAAWRVRCASTTGKTR
jgi:hypothetical protein